MPSTWISTYADPLATIAGATLVVGVTPLLGAWAYFKRKEYEAVRTRYLDDGVVSIIRQVEKGLGVFEYNWAHSLHVIRTFRDLAANTPPEIYRSGFLAFDNPASFEASRHYLLMDLIGDNVFYTVHQLLMGFLHECDNLFKNDLCSAIRVSLEGSAPGTTITSPGEIVRMYTDTLEKKHKESESYYVFLGSLQIIASALAREQYSFKKLAQFRDKQEVTSCVANLKQRFKDDLAKYPDS